MASLDEIYLMYAEPENYLTIDVQQVDALKYPNMRLYLRIEDASSGEVVENLQQGYFYVRKEDANGDYIKQTVAKVSQLNELESLNINMVADVSGSMEGDPLWEAQHIMSGFVQSVQFHVGDLVSLTSFSTGVNLECDFTGDENYLINTINNLTTGDMTSLYDALYTAVVRTASKSGAKCVIAFTDGLDNYSNCTSDDVIEVATRYHVPVFIICIGDSYNNDVVSIANQTNGACYSIDDINSIQEIYNQIYRQEKELYLLEFEDDNSFNLWSTSNVVVGYHSTEYGGEEFCSYNPNVLLSVADDNVFYSDGPEAVVEAYMKAFDDAVSNSDFSYIEQYLMKNSSIYEMQKKYVQKDISLQLDSCEIADVTYSDSNNCIVTTRETYYAQVSGKPLNLMTQICKYKVQKVSDTWYMTDFAESVDVISRLNQ